jgi:hypothetical protein
MTKPAALLATEPEPEPEVDHNMEEEQVKILTELFQQSSTARGNAGDNTDFRNVMLGLVLMMATKLNQKTHQPPPKLHLLLAISSVGMDWRLLLSTPVR